VGLHLLIVEIFLNLNILYDILNILIYNPYNIYIIN